MANAVAAAVTHDAVAGLRAGSDPSPLQAEEAARVDDPAVEAALAAGDVRYFANSEPIADRLLAWIRVNAHRIRVGAA